jgi:thiamine-phosphate pyrophosphorylase
MGELAQARAMRADAVMLSPAFPTRSHPGAASLGPVRWRLLAMRAGVPAIALGGLTRATARRLKCTRWAAIDGLSRGAKHA